MLKHNIKLDFVNFVHHMVLQVHVAWSWLTSLVALESSCFPQNYLTMLDSITFSFLVKIYYFCTKLFALLLF